MATAQLHPRAPRVPFTHPVRVVPTRGAPKTLRLLACNLSREGMFLRCPQPLQTGTRVALSLEARGRTLPFAEAEVVWTRGNAMDMPAGFGVRFVSYTNRRAGELVEYLVNNVGPDGRLSGVAPLPALEPVPLRTRWQLGLAGALTILAAGLTVTSLRARPRGTFAEPPDQVPLPIEVRAPLPPELPAIHSEPEVQVPVVPTSPSPVPSTTATPGPTTVAPAPEAAPATGIAPQPTSFATWKLPSGAVRSVELGVEGAHFTARVELAHGSEVARSFLLAGPSRLVVDVRGPQPRFAHAVPIEGKVSGALQLRIGARDDGTRLVVDLASPARYLQRAGTFFELDLVP